MLDSVVQNYLGTAARAPTLRTQAAPSSRVRLQVSRGLVEAYTKPEVEVEAT